MIRIRQIKIPVFEKQDFYCYLYKKYKLKKEEIINITIIKKSIDARKKPDLFYTCNISFFSKIIFINFCIFCFSD